MMVCVRAGEEIPGVSGRVRESSLPMLSECSSAKKMFNFFLYIVLTDKMYVHHQQKIKNKNVYCTDRLHVHVCIALYHSFSDMFMFVSSFCLVQVGRKTGP